LQRAFIEHHALQCGYCTPGFLMLALSLRDRIAGMSDDELREALSANLCRCTGYQNIVKALRAAASDRR
jgi:carbon-monoxide dehydrogenase small subunit